MSISFINFITIKFHSLIKLHFLYNYSKFHFIFNTLLLIFQKNLISIQFLIIFIFLIFQHNLDFNFVISINLIIN